MSFPCQISEMHQDALTEGSDSMTPEDFAMTCMKHGLLKSSSAKSRLQSGFADDNERSNEDIFAELKAKWESRAPEMLERLASVEDDEEREQLQARVDRHMQVTWERSVTCGIDRWCSIVVCLVLLQVHWSPCVSCVYLRL